MTTDEPEVRGQQQPHIVPDDTTCCQCGYQLRGLLDDGECPECGCAIVDSFQSKLFLYASSQSLQQMHHGAAAILLGSAFKCAFSLMFLAPLLDIPGLAGGLYLNVGILVVAGLCVLCMVGLMLVGAWTFSSWDATPFENNRNSGARAFVRTGVLTAVICPMALAVVPGHIATIAALAAVSLLVVFMAFQSIIIALAPQIPDANVARRARLHRWLIPALMIVLIGVGVLIPSSINVCIVVACLCQLLWWRNLIAVLRVITEIRAARLTTH